jgi:hypothetical protein
MKFRKKPVVIEAEQFFPDREWPKGVYIRDDQSGYFINTLEGYYTVTPGDWIITGIRGEKYPCKPDIFEATYEPVS